MAGTAASKKRPAAITIVAIFVFIGGVVQFSWAFLYPLYLSWWSAATGIPIPPSTFWFNTIVCGMLSIIVAFIYFVTGMALLRLIPWGWIMGIFIGIIALFSFPIGTTLGVIGIILLLLPSSRAAFARPIMPSPPASPQPPA